METWNLKSEIRTTTKTGHKHWKMKQVEFALCDAIPQQRNLRTLCHYFVLVAKHTLELGGVVRAVIVWFWTTDHWWVSFDLALFPSFWLKRQQKRNSRQETYALIHSFLMKMGISEKNMLWNRVAQKCLGGSVAFRHGLLRVLWVALQRQGYGTRNVLTWNVNFRFDKSGASLTVAVAFPSPKMRTESWGNSARRAPVTCWVVFFCFLVHSLRVKWQHRPNNLWIALLLELVRLGLS